MSNILPKKRAAVTCAEAFEYYINHCSKEKWLSCKFCNLFECSDIDIYYEDYLRSVLSDQEVEILLFMYRLDQLEDSEDKTKLIEVRYATYMSRFAQAMGSDRLTYST